MRIITDIVPQMVGKGNSQGGLDDNGLTFNEPGVSFNEPGVTFGGFYGFAEGYVVPHIVGYADIYTTQGTVPPGGSSGMLIGMLGITYP